MATALVLDITPRARKHEKNHKWTVMVLGGQRFALAWPDRTLRRTVWAKTAQQLLRTPVCMVLRGTAADLAVLAGGKHARI